MKEFRGTCTTCTHEHTSRTAQPFPTTPDIVRIVESQQCLHPLGKGHVDPVTGAYPICAEMRGNAKLCAWHGQWWQPKPKPTDKNPAPSDEEVRAMEAGK